MKSCAVVSCLEFARLVYRALGEQATLDPTAIEQEVRVRVGEAMRLPY